jgi:SAM-dependent methyltransferase
MEPTEDNLRAWEAAHGRGRGTVGEPGLPAPVRHALAELQGKRILVPQCGTGESAAELAALGAVVTGVDSSAEALNFARERWPTILWIQGEAGSLPRELRRGRFDLVYAGWNVDWVSDLGDWVNAIVAALRPGGDVLLYDEHPAAKSVDGLMHWREDYFADDSPQRLWRLGQIVTAVARAGLSVRALEEYPEQPGNPRHHDARVPGTFLLHAQRP